MFNQIEQGQPPHQAMGQYAKLLESSSVQRVGSFTATVATSGVGRRKLIITNMLLCMYAIFAKETIFSRKKGNKKILREAQPPSSC